MPGCPKPLSVHSDTQPNWPWLDCGEPMAEEAADGAEAVDRPEESSLVSPSSVNMPGEARLLLVVLLALPE